MRNKRRRIFYIDKVFQKRLLVLFLGLNLAIVAANIIYYLTHLKGVVEDNLFRSHITISNVAEVLAGDVIRFNLLLAVISFVLVLLFYSLTRVKLKTFFDRLKKALYTRQDKTVEEPYAFKVHEEFQEIDQVMGEFLELTDTKLADQEKRIDAIKAAADGHHSR